MFDLLSLLQGKGDKTLTGSYYADIPLKHTSVSQPFDYEILEPSSRAYQMLIGNIEGHSNIIAIKTNDPYNYQPKEHIVLQDGKLYVIESIREDISKASKEAFRNFKEIVGVEYILRLIEVENPYGLK